MPAADPFEVNNLAADPSYSSILSELRAILDGWIVETGDHGEECEEMYESEMAETLARLSRNHPAMAEQVRENIERIRQWVAAGR